MWEPQLNKNGSLNSLGMTFLFDYKKGKENRVADALFRRDELPENQEGRLAAITFP